jgi:hypothetical protein
VTASHLVTGLTRGRIKPPAPLVHGARPPHLSFVCNPAPTPQNLSKGLMSARNPLTFLFPKTVPARDTSTGSRP